jgi:NAD dependent epimerase/dehydratase
MQLKGKTVLVTGADGFIGSHLVELLLKKGCKIKALSLYNSFNYWGWLEDINLSSNIEVLQGDVRDPNYCKTITEKVDVVFHLASLIAIPYSYIAPDSYVDTNIKGALNICQSAHAAGCEKIIHISTSEVYGTAKYVPIDEDHPLQPQSPYSASKIGADAIAMSFYNAFNLPVTIARPFNTYGPRQSARAIIPSIISQIAGGKKKISIGDTTPTRDFNFVKDTCRAMVSIAESDKTIGEVINIGSNTEISVLDLFNKIKKMMGSNVTIEVETKRKRPSKSEVFRLWCDNKKIKKLTGYQPEYDLDIGLTETIKWFQNPKNLSKYKTNIYNV